MDLLSFIWTADPTKVRIGERERDEGKPKLLETTVGRVVLLLPVASDRSPGELEASVDKLFDEGGSGEQADQGDSVGDGHERGYVYFAICIILRFHHPEREGEYYTELLAGANLRTLEAPQRTSVPIMMNATTATPTADPAAIAKEKLVSTLVFGGDSSSAGGSHPISGVFSDHTAGGFLVCGIRTVVDPDSNLQRVYVPLWNVTNRFCMDDGGVCREMVDEFVAPKFFASICGMEHNQLFTEFNVRAARQISLGVEVRMRAEYNIKEKRRLKSVVEEKDSLLKSRCKEIEILKAQLLIKEVEVAEAVHLAASVKVREQEVADLDVVVTSMKLQNDSLADQVHELEVTSSRFQEKLSYYENLTERLEEFQDA
nr:hypothetical protein [Tanacetum cinerariifolium]